MSETKFTKGEWELEPSFEGRYGQGLVSSNGYDIAIVCGTNYSESPLGGFNRDWCEGFEEQDVVEHRANAYLIKTAPKLYAILKVALSEMCSLIDEVNDQRRAHINPTMGTPPDLHDQETLHEIQVLLAEARGEL